jgi:quinol-cytochrome oxidoreductase complex cytochrome b subunit
MTEETVNDETVKEEASGVLDWFSRRLNLTEIFSLLTSYGVFHAELDSRKNIRDAIEEAKAQPMPSYDQWPRVLGLLAVVLLLIEIVTGSLLAFYYLPTPQTARVSIATILRDVNFGWFVHQIHFWGAQLLIAVLIIRVLRFLMRGVYRKPRELMWVFGVLLLLVCFHSDLTGRALPMTGTAYWSSVRALELVSSIPIYGSVMLFVLGGGETVITELTLIRFYLLHVALLPFAAITLIYLHFSSVRRLGQTESSSESASPQGGPVIRMHLLNQAILFTVLLGILVSLAVLVPVPLDDAADPYATVVGVGPPWYLLAPFGFLELTAGFLPTWIAGSLLFIAFTAFVLLPFLPGFRDGKRSRMVTLALVALLLVAWIALTIYGARVA